MAGLVGFKATVSWAGSPITEMTDISIRASAEDIDVTDLGDYIRQGRPGVLDLVVSGTANYLSYAAGMLSRVHTVASFGTSAAIAVVDSKGSAVLTGEGFMMEGGLNFPQGAINQPTSFRVNSVSVP